MSTRAQAVVATEPGRVAFQTVEVPEPGPDDVVVRVLHSWISTGTEGSFIRGERIAGDTPRAPSDPLPFPHVPGYQKVGIVERVGANVTKVAAGHPVFASVSQVEGMFYPFAGHISPAVTDQSQVWKLPAGVEPFAASGLVLTQVGYNVGMRAELAAGDCAVVIGDGMVGHWAAQTLKFRGARVLLLGRHDERLKKFQAGPEDRRVNIRREDPLSAVREWASGRVQVVADTVGTIALTETLIPQMKRFSHIVSAGFYCQDGRIDIQKLRGAEITLHAPAGWTGDRVDATLVLLQTGVLKTLPLITHRFAASNCAAAYDLILSKREPALGVILDWEQQR